VPSAYKNISSIKDKHGSKEQTKKNINKETRYMHRKKNRKNLTKIKKNTIGINITQMVVDKQWVKS